MQKNATKVQNGLAATVRGSFLQLKPRFQLQKEPEPW